MRQEFRYGEQYAFMMIMFFTCVIFSVACPLITPFGVLYFAIKHYVDRHNILYVYKPGEINADCHMTAIAFVIVSTLMLQVFCLQLLRVRFCQLLRAHVFTRELEGFTFCFVVLFLLYFPSPANQLFRLRCSVIVMFFEWPQSEHPRGCSLRGPVGVKADQIRDNF
jgi:hypothetical protein